MASPTPATDSAIQAAYAEGRQMGLSIAAVAMSAVAFLSLLGLEKALLALTLALLVLREARPGSQPRNRAKIAAVIAAVYCVCFVTALIVFRAQIAELIQMLQRMG
ncbi:MAG TPA: hypothetical protein VEJ63_07435 [Planctomycetota bacterium]|nr:hypothetical protein [Planctomycetota bacterium]